MITTSYNPDVLSCLANLSNDEVFTPPNVVNDMLDLLPADLWCNPKATFLDPVSKTGVFLREIAKRLMEGLSEQFPDEQERVNHIFKNQIYGIAITELTSLLSRRSVYCSKKADHEKYSLCSEFNDEQGNIRYERLNHTWENGKCIYCGGSEEVYGREDELESYAYNFIHIENPLSLFNTIENTMKFDVIVGNPPYQLSDAGHGRSASPIYHKFIQQAKKLKPRYLAMIIPARWYSGGKGLDEFRNEMLNDASIRKLVDYENSADVFPGVDVAGGICYFLWDKDNKGKCEVTNFIGDEKSTSVRYLNEFQIFIRHGISIPIIQKIGTAEKGNVTLDKVVLPSKPFGIRGHYTPKKKGVPCYFTQRQGVLFVDESDFVDNYKVRDKYKLLIPRAPIAGQTDFSKPVGFYYEGNVRIAKPGEICTETWLVAFASKDLRKVESFKSYLFTKIFRFLLLQTVVSQDVTRNNFRFIPNLSYDQTYSDDILREIWKITDEEWAFIDSKIKAINLPAEE